MTAHDHDHDHDHGVLDEPALQPRMGEGIRVESLFLADGADVASGKLYVLGGGWTTIWSREFPTIHERLSLVILLSVPWMETNQVHPFTIDLVDEDGRSVLPQPLAGTFNMGRPAQAVPGDPFMFPFAPTINNLQLGREGRYAFVLTVDGRHLGQTAFRARLTAEG